MSQAQPQTYVPVQPQVMVMPVPRHNGLGIFAFFVALIGLFIPTGIVAILGLVLGLAAIGRAPRGFATCAVLLGLLGTALWMLVMGGLLVVGVFALVAAVAAAAVSAGAFMLTQPEVVETTTDMVNIAIAVQDHAQRHDEMPDELESLDLGVATLTDPWGTPYRVQPIDKEPGFDVVSSGADGEFGNDDDIRLSRLDRLWENAFETFGEKMELLGKKLESIDQGQRWQAGHCGPWDYAHTYEKAAAEGYLVRFGDDEEMQVILPPLPCLDECGDD